MADPPVRFLYSGIRVRNLAQSIRFYRAVGFRLERRGRMKHGGQWVHLVFPNSRHLLELNFYPRGNRFYEPIKPGNEFDHFGFFARDVEAWRRRMLRAGAKLVDDFTDGSSRLVYVTDPNGVCIEAFGPARPPRKVRRRRSK
jgi:catechol 2,3-dioxygenase-like lactoylglutathione lyase family enzyme